MDEKKETVVVEKFEINEETTGIKENGDFIPPDTKELKKLMWKIDRRIVPWLGILYLCSFLDRVNIGNAKIAGLEADIGISDFDYNWALSIFFIGYILFEIPSNLLLKKIGPNKWIPIVMISWGVTMAAMAAIHNTAGLLASRFFLGITEAGLFPGAIYYLSLWYTRQQQASRVAIFFSCSTVAGAFGGVLAYGIMQMDGIQGLRGWQWIFIIEALPTILLSGLTYFVLPDLPHRAKFLNEREREVILNRLEADAGPSTETHFSWVQFRAAFLDWKVYMHCIIYICCSTPLYSLSLFLPSIIKGMGFTSLTAQAMSAPPYAIACLFTVLCSFSSDKRKERAFHIGIPALIGGIGYMLLIVLRHRGSVAMYIASIITATGVFANVPAMLSWFNNNIGGHTKRGVAVAFIISVGNIGGAIGGQVYRIDDAPLYVRGNAICMALMFGAFVFSVIFKLMLIRENKRRDNLTPEQFEEEASREEPCDKHPGFRYIT